MLTRLLRPARSATNERGQVLVIFAFAFVAIIFMLALLFDGARGLVMRRELRNASDAAAVAGANILESINPSGCSGNVPPNEDPQAAVEAAVLASVAANLPDYNLDDVDITCPLGAGNSVVQVQLGSESPTFFGQFFGGGPLEVNTRSQAINGQDAGNQYSVILLDDSDLSWPQARRGCPSFLLSGGPTVKFDSSIYINSDCTAANGGALATNGNATTLELGSEGPKIRIVGEYKPQALTITPAPVEGANPKPDPLKYLDLPPPSSDWPSGYVAEMPPGYFDTPTKFTSTSSLKVRETGPLTIGGGGTPNETRVLKPGVYKGGIVLNNSSVALLEPGIYVIYGGGIQLKASSTMMAVDSGVQSFPAVWGNACHDGSCGVMIFNTGTQTGSAKMGQIQIGAQATFKMRSYDSSITVLNSPSSILNDAAKTHYSNPAYDHMAIWQSRSPAATSSYAQPMIDFQAGATVDVSGTMYAPQAKVSLGGGPNGSGGGTLTLQFIVWDLELSGNSTFHFVYKGDEFVTPPDYGLIL